MAEFFYNIRTGQVEEGRVSDWSQLMGPYASREEAQHALEKARARNEAWDAQDAQDEQDD